MLGLPQCLQAREGRAVGRAGDIADVSFGTLQVRKVTHHNCQTCFVNRPILPTNNRVRVQSVMRPTTCPASFVYDLGIACETDIGFPFVEFLLILEKKQRDMNGNSVR